MDWGWIFGGGPGALGGLGLGKVRGPVLTGGGVGGREGLAGGGAREGWLGEGPFMIGVGKGLEGVGAGFAGVAGGG